MLLHTQCKHKHTAPGLFLRGKYGVQVFEGSPDQVQASGNEDVDLGGVAERRGLGGHTGLDGDDPFAWVGQHRVPALRDPLEGAEDAGEDQCVVPALGNPRQGTRDQELRPRLLALASQQPPALLVVQATCEHVLHGDVEVLLVCQEKKHKKPITAPASPHCKHEDNTQQPVHMFNSSPCSLPALHVAIVSVILGQNTAKSKWYGYKKKKNRNRCTSCLACLT